MSKIADFLQEHVLGEVIDSPELRRQLAVDGSVLSVTPMLAVYPRNELDVRKTARFCWQLAERGRNLPITARGGGSDTSGAAIGGGIIMLFTGYMNKILELEPKKKTVTVEPGISYDKLQQTLYTHGLFFPPYPASSAYATIGGGLANNSVGSKSVKYGGTQKYVEGLRVVLANGEVIETGPLSHREFNRKMGLTSFEGHIYRTLDALLEENWQTVEKYGHKLGAGYNLKDVKKKDGFDLTPLFIGSQGTLGIITSATLRLENHNPEISLAVVSIETIEGLSAILPKLLALKPSMVDLISKSLLETVARLSPKRLADIPLPKDCPIHLFVEFDDSRESTRKDKLKQLTKLADGNSAYVVAAGDIDDRHKLLSVQQAISSLLLLPDGPRRALPVAESLVLPTDQLAGFLKEAEAIFAAANLAAPFWGHAGSGALSYYPHLDLAQVGDRQKLFKLNDGLYSSAIAHGGHIGANNEGRIRAPQAHKYYGDEYRQLILKVKSIFDPHKILNPGVKTADNNMVLAMMREDYRPPNHHSHLPKS